MRPGTGRLVLSGLPETRCEGPDPTGRLDRLARRLLERLARLTGERAGATAATGVAITLSVSESSAPSPALGEDESYRLVVGEGGVVLGARTTGGALRGVETLLQLVRSGPEGWELPACEVSDRPRFAWRGLLLDPARHFLPVAALRRTVEAMAAVKLNVLHLHLSDDQAFRLESRVVPELTAAGSDGRFFTQAELRELVALAADYGIRVVPELDVPGHTTSWLVGRPDLASGPGPHRLRARFGIARDALDPTNEAVYDVVDALLGELADLFPDAFVHVGGDEVRRETWLDNERIAGWMKANGVASPTDLQARFTARVTTLARGHGRRAVGWDEVLHPDVPGDVVVQVWRGGAAVHQAVAEGRDVVVSWPYYLDRHYGVDHYHAVDPLDGAAAIRAAREALLADPALGRVAQLLAPHLPTVEPPEGTPPIGGDAAAHVLGGEACLWGELVDEDVLDTRLWPSIAAVADRLWSDAAGHGGGGPAELTDRLEVTTRWVEQATRARPLAGSRAALARVAGRDEALTGALATLAEAVEPAKWYARVGADPRGRTVATPLNRLVDAVPAQSLAARRFTSAAADAATGDEGGWEKVLAAARRWADAAGTVATAPPGNHLLDEARPAVAAVGAIAQAVLLAGSAVAEGRTLTSAEGAQVEQLLEEADRPLGEIVVVVVEPARRLVAGARGASVSEGRG